MFNVGAFLAETVNEVKRTALLGLQKAMAESEAKASQLLATERAKVEAAVVEVRRRTMEEMILTFNAQQESTEVVNIHRVFAYLSIWQ